MSDQKKNGRAAQAALLRPGAISALTQPVDVTPTGCVGDD